MFHTINYVFLSIPQSLHGSSQTYTGVNIFPACFSWPVFLIRHRGLSIGLLPVSLLALKCFACSRLISETPPRAWGRQRSFKLAPMERQFRSYKSEWMPSNGYKTVEDARRDIGFYLMDRYNWRRPHQYNDGLPPAVTEEKLKKLSEISWPLQILIQRNAQSASINTNPGR